MQELGSLKSSTKNIKLSEDLFCHFSEAQSVSVLISTLNSPPGLVEGHQPQQHMI